MFDLNRRGQAGLELKKLADWLDVSESKYREAKEHYGAVGQWLNGEDAEIAAFSPEIYPQGSFSIGTAIRPIGEGEYDVDAVCELRIARGEITPSALKQMVGARLRAHKTYARMLDPADGGKRCWTLKYNDDSRFHMDILPAIPDDPAALLARGVEAKFATSGVCITDRTCPDWLYSNPRGYAAWFKERMKVILRELKKSRAMEKRAAVHEIQDFEVRTPLQRAVQLLKRHRDNFYGDAKQSPASIIITTLAAGSYENQPDLLDALDSIVVGVRDWASQGDRPVLRNPVQPEENFTDRWEPGDGRVETFREWVEDFDAILRDLQQDRGLEKTASRLEKAYSRQALDEALTPQIAHPAFRPSAPRVAGALEPTSSKFDVPHRERATWPANFSVSVKIEATRKSKQTRKWIPLMRGEPLRKNQDLQFKVVTDLEGDFEVFWQVVNTGREAAAKGGLRGSIESGENASAGGLHRRESTEYAGTHWIECYLVRDGVCLGRSGEFMVRII